jgi:phenylalanyl-tRNA synthetase beta chain
MKFSISWLKEHLETKASNNEIIEKLTAIGLEVERWNDASQIFANFVIGQVLEEKKHPNADKLKVCKVDTGTDKVDVVCGATNVEKGMKVVYAPPGSVIPINQMKLKATKIRGVESRGMMCSEHELGLSDNHEGIIKLSDKSIVGQPYSEISGINDVVIEVGVTPNRQDCLGVLGLARDIAATGLGKLKVNEYKKQKGSFKSPIGIEINNIDLCSCFAGRYFRNVKNVQSPEWLQKKLKAVDLRPISALVDITNYVMLDLNRPLHVYDADKIDGKIIVRQSKKGESFNALDENSYELLNGMCAIADEKKVLGLGGIMGGEGSGCTENTSNILLESALFNPVSIAKSGRILEVFSVHPEPSPPIIPPSPSTFFSSAIAHMPFKSS